MWSRLPTYLDSGKIRLPKADWWKLAELLGQIEAQVAVEMGEKETRGKE